MKLRTIKGTATRIGACYVLVIALACTALSSPAQAQDSLDFIDPLKDERTRIERSEPRETPAENNWRPRPAPAAPPAALAEPPSRESSTTLLRRAREGASSSAEAVEERASGFWGKMRATLSKVAAGFGVSVLTLIALLLLFLIGIAFLVSWTLFRGRGKYKKIITADELEDGDDPFLYAHDTQSQQNRRSATHDTDFETERQTSAQEEAIPEGFDSIFSEERAERPADPPTMPAPVPVQNTSAPKDADDTGDTSTWRKPNLDRLRNSIKSDWLASKKGSARTNTQTDPGDQRLSDISDGWEQWDSSGENQDDPWGETQAAEKQANAKVTDDEALRRIRALRQSLGSS